MATKTQSRSRRSTRTTGSAFKWNGNQAGVVAAAAVAGAAVGFAASFGRRLMAQGMGAGDWADALAAEHKAVLALFDQLEATGDRQASARAHLLARIKSALGKHALEEENVIYPALREANSTHDADALNAEHGYVKTYLYELENMPKEGPAWLARAREFRTMIEAHMRMEEEEVFPALHGALDAEKNAKLSTAMFREGLKLA